VLPPPPLLEELGAETVIVPAQAALCPLQFPLLADTVTLEIVCAVLMTLFMEVGDHERPLVTLLVPQVTAGLVGAIPVVIACVTELQVSFGLTVNEPQFAVCPLQFPLFAVALIEL
jgi:hypothetical protein